MQSRLHGLYAITDNRLMPDTASLLRAVEAALCGGTRIVQYRDKSSDPALRQHEAGLLSELCRHWQAHLIINDDVELAARVGAGVHLGQSDGDPTLARERLGPDAIIGVTCHDRLDLALRAQQQGADYVAFGAFFNSSTKPEALPAPLSLLPTAKGQITLPIVAIGGLSVDNAPQVIRQGADMIAVVHQLFAAPDITARAQAFTALFDHSGQQA